MTAPVLAPMQVGQFVTHARKHEWGPGKILRVDGEQALVFFVDAGIHNGATRNPLAVLTSFLKPSRLRAHAQLDNLPPLQGESVTGDTGYVTLEQGIKLFLNRFPKGFTDPAYFDKQREYKLKAHAECRRLLAKGALKTLLLDQDFEEIVKRALQVTAKVNLPTPWDHMALRDGLNDLVDQRRFALALNDLLHGAGSAESRFTAFADVLGNLPQKQARVLTWPNQTILLFLWDPTHQMFMKPGVTQQAANRRAFDLRYRPEPNWDTYNQLLTLAGLLFKDLAKLRPKDNIDVQSFIWLIGEH